MSIGPRGARLITEPLSRRRFLTPSALAVGTGLTPGLTHAQQHPSKAPQRWLELYNVNTKEHLKTVYWAEGQYVTEALVQIDHLLRDHRANEVTVIDQKLINLLYALAQTLQTHEPVHIMSAYRSPATNARMRQCRRGVAKKSQHIYGKAVDVWVPERHLTIVRQAALALRGGGVGYYRRSNFLHIDTGPVRSW